MMEPRILIYDIETSYLLLKTFQLRNDQTIPFGNIVRERNILTAAWKWRGDKKAQSITINPKRPTDDRRIIQKLIELFNEADATVAHYGDGFDHKYILTRAVHHGFKPPNPVVQIDTWKIARSKFLFNSNRLDYLGHFLGLGRKIKTDHTLWDGCMAGDEFSIKKMAAYNRQDVDLLAKVFDRLSPYANTRIQTLLAKKNQACANCGSAKLQRRGKALNQTGEHIRYQCQSCGKWSLGRAA